MNLPSRSLRESACWLVRLRWVACISVFIVIWIVSSVYDIVQSPAPLYLVGFVMIFYNVILHLICLRWKSMIDEQCYGPSVIVTQIVLDLIALTLLLYFSDIAHNPFISYFVFHMIIAGILLPGRLSYLLAGLASILVGAAMLIQYGFGMACHSINISHFSSVSQSNGYDGLYILGVFIAFVTTLAITVFFTTEIQKYVQKAQQKIRQQEKILGIGQLVAGFAHQISNPLDGLQNCISKISDRINDAHCREYILHMSKSLERIERIAKRLQEFARPHGIKMAEFDLNDALGEVALLLERTSEELNVNVSFSLGGVGKVWGDAYAIQEVVFHLCTNAFAAMPSGGNLTVRSIPCGKKDKYPSNYIVIEVEDTGSGIAEDKINSIFEPFVTTRSQSGGTGLGLWICKMLISEIGGEIRVSSVPGKGTIFSVFVIPSASHSFIEGIS